MIKPWWWYFYLPHADIKSLIHHNPTTTAFIEKRRLQAEQKGELFSLKWSWIPLESVSPYFISAVVKVEDARFWTHKGIMWRNVFFALRANIKLKQMKYGASTITQQVIKNLYLSPTKNIFRKLLEWILARKLERHLSKKRILEIYVNIVELGPQIFGIEEAAKHWYECSALNLQPQQAARLALSLPAPLKRSPDKKLPSLDFISNQLVLKMHKEGLLKQEHVRQALWTGT